MAGRAPPKHWRCLCAATTTQYRGQPTVKYAFFETVPCECAQGIKHCEVLLHHVDAVMCCHCPVMCCQALSCVNDLCAVVALSCVNESCAVMRHLIMSWHVLSCAVMFPLTLSCAVMRILSCAAQVWYAQSPSRNSAQHRMLTVGSCFETKFGGPHVWRRLVYSKVMRSG